LSRLAASRRLAPANWPRRRYGLLGLVGAPDEFLPADTCAQGLPVLLGRRVMFIRQALDRAGRVCLQRSVGPRLLRLLRLLGSAGSSLQGRVVAFGIRLAVLGDALDGPFCLPRYSLKDDQ
jgi:hypothetical protein